jgi:hypothetical protein
MEVVAAWELVGGGAPYGTENFAPADKARLSKKVMKRTIE